jgi:hypothetical protein
MTAYLHGDFVVRTEEQPQAALYTGKKTVAAAGTAEALGESQTLTVGVTIKAEADNTGTVYVGDEDVDSASGFQLAKGESIFIPINDLAAVYLDVSVSGDGVTYLAQ